MVQVSIIVPLSRNAGAVWPELRQILNEYSSEIEVVCVASSRKSFLWAVLFLTNLLCPRLLQRRLASMHLFPGRIVCNLCLKI